MDKKILFIVGASSDFGTELIKKSIGDFDTVIAHYNKSKEKLTALQKEYGDKLKLLQCDLLDDKASTGMVDTIKSDFGAPSHIAHFPAEKVAYSKFAKTDWQSVQRSLDLQVKSFFNILHSFMPAMAKNKYGRIVVMLSSYTKATPPNYMLPYITAKYALLGMMKSLAVEYAPKNVNINAVSPSTTQTRFLENMPDFLLEKIADENPAKRLAQVSDVVPMIKYLLSDEASYITGQNILISGGS